MQQKSLQKKSLPVKIADNKEQQHVAPKKDDGENEETRIEDHFETNIKVQDNNENEMDSLSFIQTYKKCKATILNTTKEGKPRKVTKKMHKDINRTCHGYVHAIGVRLIFGKLAPVIKKFSKNIDVLDNFNEDTDENLLLHYKS